MDPTTSTIVIERAVTAWADLARNWKVLVNGETVGKLKSGASGSYVVPSDEPVTVEVRVDWTGSEKWEGTLRSGETAHFVVDHARSLLAGMLSTDRYLVLTRKK